MCRDHDQTLNDSLGAVIAELGVFASEVRREIDNLPRHRSPVRHDLPQDRSRRRRVRSHRRNRRPRRRNPCRAIRLDASY